MWLTDGLCSGGCWQGAPCRLPGELPLSSLPSQSLLLAGGGSSFSSSQCDRAPASFCHQAHVSSSGHTHLGTCTCLWPPPQRKWMPAMVCGQLNNEPQSFSSPQPVNKYIHTFHGERDFTNVIKLRWGGDTGLSRWAWCHHKAPDEKAEGHS